MEVSPFAMKMLKFWRSSEVETLIEGYGKGTIKMLASKLGRSYISVQHKSRRLGLSALSKVRELNCCERAYLGALIDGEGSIFITKSTRKKSSIGFSYVPVVNISNNNVEILRKVRKIVGAGCSPCVEKPRFGNRKKSYYVRFSASAIRQLLPQILDWLVVKRRQADLLLEFLKLSKKRFGGYGGSRPPTAREHEVYKELKKLNRRGVG